MTRGEIYIDGVNVKDYRIEALREKVGIVLQKAQLFKGTIRDNIRWGKKDATDTEIMEALDIAQAREFVEKKTVNLIPLSIRAVKFIRRTAPAFNDCPCSRKKTGYFDFRRQCIGTRLCNRCGTAQINP